MKTFRYYLYEHKFSPSSIHEMERSVSQFLNYLQAEHIPLKQCSYADVLGYVSHFQYTGKQASYINQMLGHLRHYFQYLKSTKQVKTNPAAGLRIQKQFKAKIVPCLTEEQLASLYFDFQSKVLYQNDLLKQRDTVILGLILFQAIQIGELALILTTDVNLFEGNIYIPATKRSQDRLLPLHAAQISTLNKFIEDRPKEKLFTLNMQKHLPNLFRRMEKYLSYKPDHPLLRQSRIMVWLKQHHIRQVQYFAGMKYVSSLKKYQAQEISGLMDKVDRFHPLK